MEKYTDTLREHKPRYQIGPKVVLAWVDSEKQIQVEKLSQTKDITFPLHTLSDEEWEQLKIALHSALPHASQEWVIDGGKRGLGLFGIKNYKE